MCGVTLEREAILVMISDLDAYSEQQVLDGLKRCRLELKPEKGFVTLNLAVLLEKMGIPGSGERDRLEMARDWETVRGGFYLCSDCPYFHLDHRHDQRMEQLSDQGTAAYRRVGGATRILHRTPADLYFVERDFREQWQLAGSALGDDSRLLPAAEVIARLVKPAEPEPPVVPLPPEKPAVTKKPPAILREMVPGDFEGRVRTEQAKAKADLARFAAQRGKEPA